MIHYHGTPITPDHAAATILAGRHGLVSFAHPNQISLVAEVCQSFVLDNGAFSFWRSGKPVDWDNYYQWVEEWRYHPAFDWALIPDIIEGSEDANDDLVGRWPFDRSLGVPVWHLNESLTRLALLASAWPRIALGSSGEYARVGSAVWWDRIDEAMMTICDDAGRPATKLHGLRMLDPRISGRLPFSSADSCNIARNIGIDKNWQRGNYPPPTKAARGVVMATRIEATQSAPVWAPVPTFVPTSRIKAS